MNREIGSEFYNIYNSKKYYQYLKEIKLKKYMVRSGRDALRLIANNLNNKRIILPSYCCDSMISPFADTGFTIEYYRIDNNFEIDYDDLFKKLDNSSSCLIMNYFGFNDIKSYSNEIKKRCPNCNIIFDFTHSIFDVKEFVCNNVDYYICSMRKCMPIIESGLVLTKKTLFGLEEYVDNDFSINRKKAFELKQKYIINPFNETLKDEYRKLFYKADSSLDVDKRIISASNESIDYIKNLNYEYIIQKRNANYNYLFDLLKDKFNLVNRAKTTPFMLPIFIENRDEVQLKLAKKGIFTQVIWPINEEQKECSIDSKIHANTILCIPIDQRYDLYDMNRIFEALNEE